MAHRQQPALAGPLPCSGPGHTMVYCGLGLVQRDREKKAAGWRDGSCCAAASSCRAGTVRALGEGVSEGWAGARCPCLSRRLPCPFLSSGLGPGSLFVPLRLMSRPAWRLVSGSAAEPAAQGPRLLPKAVRPAWVEALCHWSQWKRSGESKFRPGPSPTSRKSFPFPVHPVI